MRYRWVGAGVLIAVVLAGCVAGAPPRAAPTPTAPLNAAPRGTAPTASPVTPSGTPLALTPSAPALGSAAPTPEPTLLATLPQLAESRHTFIDTVDHTQLLIYLDPSVAHYGAFSFAAQGAGLFGNVRPATIDVAGPHAVDVSYDGAGTLDPAARLDFVFGLDWPSGQAQPAAIRLTASLDPIAGAASADLWTGGAHYRLRVQPPPRNADQALAAVLRAYRNEDWSALYDLYFSGLRAQLSRADFVARISTGVAGWRVVDAQVVSPITYSDGQAGFFMAVAQVRITRSRQGATRTDVAQAELLWENGRWALLTLGTGPTPAPS